MFNSKRIEELEARIKDLEDALGRENHKLPVFFGIGGSYISLRTNKKIDLILQYLGLEYKDKCTETLPKLVKKAKRGEKCTN